MCEEMRKKLTPLMRKIAVLYSPGIFAGGLDEDVQRFREFLAERITQEESLMGAANRLGVDPSTLWRWCMELDVELRVSRTTIAHTVAVLPEQETQPA